MRVLHIINGEFYSGAERVQDLLAMRLPEFGYDVHLACLKPGLFETNCKCDVSRIICFPMRSRLDPSQCWKLAGFIRENDFRIIHTHTPRTAMIGRPASAITGVPMVHHVRSPADSCTDNPFRNRINAFAERISIKGIKKVITVSESLKQYMINRKIDSGLIAVVPNGVPTPGRLPDRPLPAGIWKIGTVALFRPRKGLEIILKSLAQLKENSIKFLFRAVGNFETKSYESEIKNLVHKLNLTESVKWVGFSRDVNQELLKMDIFVLPSLVGEGTPMVILEAMAAGVPVVGTKIEGMPEVICDERYGLLVAPGDSQSLTFALTRIIKHKISWSQLRKNAFQRQAGYYSDTRMARDVAKLYDKIIIR
jgi:glycosyltransferase involved in cell wall biosynthesis